MLKQNFSMASFAMRKIVQGHQALCFGADQCNTNYYIPLR